MARSNSFAPLFVFGVARSGTNLIAGMLNARGSVALALDPLMPFFKSLRNAMIAARAPEAVARRFDPASPFQDYYFDADGRVLLDTIMTGRMDLPIDEGSHHDLVDAIRARASLESPRLSQQLAGLTGGTYRKLCDSVLERIAATSAGKQPVWVGTKEVWTIEFIPVLAAAYPKARFIVSQRDPRAVIASLAAQAAIDPTQAAHGVSYLRHWRKQVSVCSVLQEDPRIASRLRVQSYEALVQCPEIEAKIMCGFLGTRYAPRMLNPVTPEGRPFTGNSSYGVIRGVSSEPAEQWRGRLSAEARKAVEFHCGPEMVFAGYELEEHSPGSLDDAVWHYVHQANAESGSWRSDSGDPELDSAAESSRWALLKEAGEAGEEEIRQHFLFASSYRHIREALTSGSRTVCA